MVSGRIAGWISFGLDDSATQSAAFKVVYHDLSDEKPGERDGVVRQLVASQPTYFEL